MRARAGCPPRAAGSASGPASRSPSPSARCCCPRCWPAPPGRSPARTCSTSARPPPLAPGLPERPRSCRTGRRHDADADQPAPARARLVHAAGARPDPRTTTAGTSRSRAEFGQDALPAVAARRSSSGGQPARMRYDARRRARSSPSASRSRRSTPPTSRSSSLDELRGHARGARRLARSAPRSSRRSPAPPSAGGPAAARCGRWPSVSQRRRGHRRRPARHPPRGQRRPRPRRRSPTSFNDMAQALQDRIERDARFASDVSHELRSPLMTLAASIEVLENQREELPERAAGRARPDGRRRSTASSSWSRTCSRSPASTPASSASSSTRCASPSSCCRPSSHVRPTPTCPSSSTPSWPAWSSRPTSAASSG